MDTVIYDKKRRIFHDTENDYYFLKSPELTIEETKKFYHIMKTSSPEDFDRFVQILNSYSPRERKKMFHHSHQMGEKEEDEYIREHTKDFDPNFDEIQSIQYIQFIDMDEHPNKKRKTVRGGRKSFKKSKKSRTLSKKSKKSRT